MHPLEARPATDPKTAIGAATVPDLVADIWRYGSDRPAPLDRLLLTGAEPGLPSSFRVGAAGQAGLASVGLMAAALWRARSSRDQTVSVDMDHAMTEIVSERQLLVEGAAPTDLWDAIAGLYPTGDGRFVRLHTNFPHHRDGLLDLLGCANDREAVARALRGWEAERFETEATARGLVVAMARRFDEWDAHPQCRSLRAAPLMEITRIGEAPPTPLPADGDRPLAGIRVLELTRIIAGPVGGRCLAAHGADVLLITAPHLPAVAPLVVDTGRGKRSAQLDLRTVRDKARMDALLGGADVFLHGYRPGALAGLGYPADRVAALRPGIVQAEIDAYGYVGPWAGKRGFDSLVQTATGFNWAEAEAAGSDTPKPLPAQALDHVSGYLLSFGVMAALLRRAEDGGSWRVRVSLAQTANWLRGLGRLADGLDAPGPCDPADAGFLEERPSGFGRLVAVRHSARLSETPPYYARPAVPLGTDRPGWD